MVRERTAISVNLFSDLPLDRMHFMYEPWCWESRYQESVHVLAVRPFGLTVNVNINADYEQRKTKQLFLSDDFA